MKTQHIIIFGLVAILMLLVFLVIDRESQLGKAIVENEHLKNINEHLMSQQEQPKKQVWYRKTQIGYKPEQLS